MPCCHDRKIKNAIDKGDVGGTLLTDLSKAFDYILHDLLTEKFHAYGFSPQALKLLHSYFSQRNQRIRIDTSFSNWLEIAFGVPQGSTPGPLLFNIYLNDIC